MFILKIVWDFFLSRIIQLLNFKCNFFNRYYYPKRRREANNSFLYLFPENFQIHFHRKNIRIQSRTLIAQIGQRIVNLDAFVFEPQSDIGLETYFFGAVQLLDLLKIPHASP